jgi:predicted nucleic acid-binding protein
VIVVADTSGIIAASDRNADEFASCRAVLQEAGTVVISPLVLTEVDHLAKARFGPAARSAIIDFILEQAALERVLIPATGPDVLQPARALQRQYADLDLDLADAVNVVLAARHATRDLLTLDERDFRAIRPRTSHRWFRLLPHDQ